MALDAGDDVDDREAGVLGQHGGVLRILVVDADQEPAAVGPYVLVLGMRQGQEVMARRIAAFALQVRAGGTDRQRAVRALDGLVPLTGHALHLGLPRRGRAALARRRAPHFPTPGIGWRKPQRLRRDPSLSGYWGKHRKPGVGANYAQDTKPGADARSAARFAGRASWLGCWSGSFRSPAGRSARGRRVAVDRRLVAGGQLPLRRPDLPARQSAPARAAGRRARQAAPARPLGHDARAQSDLGASQPRHPGA